MNARVHTLASLAPDHWLTAIAHSKQLLLACRRYVCRVCVCVCVCYILFEYEKLERNKKERKEEIRYNQTVLRARLTILCWIVVQHLMAVSSARLSHSQTITQTLEYMCALAYLFITYVNLAMRLRVHVFCRFLCNVQRSMLGVVSNLLCNSINFTADTMVDGRCAWWAGCARRRRRRTDKRNRNINSSALKMILTFWLVVSESTTSGRHMHMCDRSRTLISSAQRAILSEFAFINVASCLSTPYDRYCYAMN